MYFFAAPVFCWLIQQISASPTLRPISNVRTRPQLAPRIDPYDYGDGQRRPDYPPVYGGSNGGRQPVYQIPNGGGGRSNPQPGGIFDLGRLSQGIGEGDGQQGRAWGPDANWHDPQYQPTYGYSPLPNMLVSTHEAEVNNPVRVEAPSSIRSRTTRPTVSRPRGQRIKEGEEGYAQYKRRQDQNRANQRAYRIRQAQITESEKKDALERVEQIEKQAAAMQSRALASWSSDLPSERDRAVYAAIDYERSLLEYMASSVEIPVGEPEGGYHFSAEDEWPDYGPSSVYGTWDPMSEPSRKLARSGRYNSDGVIRHETSLQTRQTLSSNPTDEFTFYIDVYTQLRSNVSGLLFPYFSNILSHTNSSSIYEMLRSVHSDLVAAGPWTIGPYSNGADCFDWIEYQLFGNITNSTLLNDTIIRVLATDNILIDIYSDIWGNASQIANQTGYLSQMSTVRRYLNPTNISLLPDTWKTAQPLPRSLDFDALYGKYNKTLSQ